MLPKTNNYQNQNDYAILIGVENYPNATGELESIPSALSDCSRVFDWLTHSAGGSIPPENVKKLTTNEKLNFSGADIDDEFENLICECKDKREKPRRLYFYFSGHGFGLQRDDTALVLPKWSSSNVKAVMSSRDYLNVIWDSGVFSQVVLWLDCCRTRRIKVVPQLSRLSYHFTKEQSKTYLSYATDFHNSAFYAYLKNRQSMSIYTTALLEGLDTGRVIDSHDLAEFLDTAVPKLAEKHNVSQKPENVHYSNRREIVFRQTM